MSAVASALAETVTATQIASAISLQAIEHRRRSGLRSVDQIFDALFTRRARREAIRLVRERSQCAYL